MNWKKEFFRNDEGDNSTGTVRIVGTHIGSDSSPIWLTLQGHWGKCQGHSFRNNVEIDPFYNFHFWPNF